MGNLSNTKTYTTLLGNEVDRAGYSLATMNDLDYHIEHWLEGWYNTTDIIYNMSLEEIHYLIQHMESTETSDDIPTGHLVRLEARYHTNNLKEGDTLQGTNLFRSFSKNANSTDELIDNIKEWGGGDVSDYVIYRTVGNTPYFDPTKFSNPYPSQTECFVPMDTMKVSKIHTVTDDDELYFLTGVDQHIPNNQNVKVIDIAVDSNVNNIPVNLSDGNYNIKI